MFAHAYTILGIVVAVFLIAKALRLSTELSMLASAIAAAAYHGAVWSGEFPLRHLVEGMFTYFDVCLIFISATFFMGGAMNEMILTAFRWHWVGVGDFP